MVTEFRVGWVVRLRKKHPCGGSDWEVVRIGADIGLRCATCDRRVMMPRSDLEKRMKSFVSTDD
ncbi:MAG: DUF951 domain-containing protein [SAR202 cluster bacterium]|nr:DUF951 domain-containing protein [SAR202 cluster bacterium]MDP6301401.1 DUF951 domain-containing protein [SAR202 cluster bacterium]MDP7104219.1 DUF951 domain-containing protein [SAR202 cluster bacterium]MDP7226102.1 DUF951 domain-containing protein [SAR202 cluster bacterium]MDP7412865.1 DUF951 domain-containing protein [SAR202 cluster bacterium]